jgi:hypothetical protein
MQGESPTATSVSAAESRQGAAVGADAWHRRIRLGVGPDASVRPQREPVADVLRRASDGYLDMIDAVCRA